MSLQEPTPPTPIDIPADSNVEMTWHAFGGEHHDTYMALLRCRCYHDGIELTPENINKQFRLHLHRGINYLATPNKIANIVDLISLSFK